MKKVLLFLALLFISGCTSFGRGVAEAILNKDNTEDHRQCDIIGEKINGINDYFQQNKIVKVMMIHGVGSHTPGYATRIRENLAKSLDLTVFSKRAKDITLLNPEDGKTEIGNLQVIRMQNEERTKDLIFYELTWSNITSKQKKILDYDTSGKYAYKRAPFNHNMKKFLNDTVPDPMIYLIDKDNLILNATKQASCWMLGHNWDQLKNNQKQVCRVSSYNQLKDLSNENIIYITHSLGSRILMDSMTDIVNEIAQADVHQNRDAELIINELKNKNITVFMLANQLPILQIGRKSPAVTNQISSYCKKKGKNYHNRVFKQVDIVAFSDPNDLLSYDIPQSFVDSYIDSRMCPSLTNVNINIAEEISAFGLSVVNPVASHTEYDNDERVIEMISQGTRHLKEDKVLNKKCRFIELDD